MSWPTLSSTHVLARLSTDEKDALEAVGEDTSTDKLTDICSQVTERFRDAVATSGRYTLDSAGTIPPGALFHAVTIARAALIAAQPTREGVTDPRAMELKSAEKYLEDLAAGKVAVADPDGTYPSEAAEGTASYGGADLLDF